MELMRNNVKRKEIDEKPWHNVRYARMHEQHSAVVQRMVDSNNEWKITVLW